MLVWNFWFSQPNRRALELPMLLQEFELDKQESARASNRDGLQNTFSSDRIICGISWQRRPKLRPTSTEPFGDWVKKSWDQRPSKCARLCVKETFKWSNSPSSVWSLISRGWRGRGGGVNNMKPPGAPIFLLYEPCTDVLPEWLYPLDELWVPNQVCIAKIANAVQVTIWL